jgi:hypothetical protein
MNLTWQFQAAVEGGPSVTINQPNLPISGYDVVTVTVPGSTSSFPVLVQPSSGSGDVILMVITADKYDTPLSFTVDAIATSHVLDGPHVLLGGGAVSLLNSAASPQKLIFKNTGTNDIEIQILAGRKA